MQSAAPTVDAYLASLPEDRRRALQAVREVILANLDRGFEEGMAYGMIGYGVPHRLYPAGYHCDPSKPVPYAGLASQKNYMSLYLMCTYGDPAERAWFEAAWRRTGKKLDMGAACVRFRKLEDLPLDVIAEAFRRTPLKAFRATYEATLRRPAKPAAAKATPKAAPSKAVK
jgi:hypothetical protein